ncbi:unnamed protein product [Calicophoron daubneyi]|uniref:Sidoreflexin n=1 Tax=Calicophoron daubneyi TaxID=300641 RepID=A0AAV2TPH2_CALDB
MSTSADIYSHKINIEKPRYDQSTFVGRAKHFFITTNPLNVLKTPSELDAAKSIVQKYRAGEKLPGLTVDELWRAKQVYDSAFHPDTGEKMTLVGRMSFQVPGNMFITGCLLQFYKTAPAVIFWQWFNQTFNAIVNYTNRSGDSPISVQRLTTSYVLASTGAVVTALGINNQVKHLPPIVGRFVPFVAVAAANCINIPCMRSSELTKGTQIVDEHGQNLGESRKVARRAIFKVILCRILMATPGMIFPPFVMDALEKKGVLARYPWIGAPLQVGMVGIFLTFATPMACAIFPQMSSIAFSKLEPDVQAKIRELRKDNVPTTVYYNKGL